MAASFAFGNVTQILRFLERLFLILGPFPHAALTASRPVSLSSLSGLSYRFLSRNGVHRFLFSVRAVLLEYGSLEALYARGMVQGEGSARDRLAEFLARFREAWGEKIRRERDFLFPDPRRGSACKRHNMFLRWVVREDDGVDLGIWTVVRSRHLIVPLDTHMARLGRWLGLTSRNSAGWRMAEEITEGFRVVCPEDPVRYDFALTRIGILKACTRPVRGICSRCPLEPVCGGRTGPLRTRGRAMRAVLREENGVAHPSPSGIDLGEMPSFPGTPGRRRENGE